MTKVKTLRWCIIVDSCSRCINRQQNRFIQTCFQDTEPNRRIWRMLYNCWEWKQHFIPVFINGTKARKQSYFKKIPWATMFTKTCGKFDQIFKKRTMQHNENSLIESLDIPNWDKTSIVIEPLFSNAWETSVIWREYNKAKWSSHKRSKTWRTLLLMLWLKR